MYAVILHTFIGTEPPPLPPFPRERVKETAKPLLSPVIAAASSLHN